MPNRVALIARYDTGLDIRRPVDRYMRSEDPYGTLDFVEFGVKRGEIRDDVDAEMIASILDWMADRFQDALVSEDLDPGLIHRRPERRPMRIKEFVEVLRSGIAPSAGVSEPRPRYPRSVSFSTSVLRPLTLRVAEHPWSRRIVTGTRPGRAVASRFVAGESLEEAMTVAASLDRRRITSMLDLLGENVRTEAQAEAARAAYLDALAAIRGRPNLDCAISLKPTQLGLDMSVEACLANVEPIVEAASAPGDGRDVRHGVRRVRRADAPRVPGGARALPEGRASRCSPTSAGRSATSRRCRRGAGSVL